MNRPIHVRLVADMLEENWPSMDLFAEMLAASLPEVRQNLVSEVIRFPLRRRVSAVIPGTRATTADRLIGRHVDYPGELRRLTVSPGLVYHIVDQSYAASALALPPERLVITCHDLDVFRVLFETSVSAGSAVLARLARRTLDGFKRARVVICDTEAVRRQLIERNLAPASEVHVIHAGVHPVFSPAADQAADERVQQMLGKKNGPEILHVGSPVERKRIDVLLTAFAGVRKQFPHSTLIRVGGKLSRHQSILARVLEVAGSIRTLPFLGRDDLAAIYRRADLLVLPSDREGFGLPIIEAIACGTPVIASDIDVLKEVGGSAAMYAPPSDAPSWISRILAALAEQREQPDSWQRRRQEGLERAAEFSWDRHASRLATIYETLVHGDQ